MDRTQPSGSLEDFLAMSAQNANAPTDQTPGRDALAAILARIQMMQQQDPTRVTGPTATIGIRG